MNGVVIDTNVPVVANGGGDCSLECQQCCIEELEDVINFGKVLVDDKQLIFGEYWKNLSFSGQPGVGDAFFKWLWNNQANIERCNQVSVTIIEGRRRFNEFPDDPDLENFDYDDRIFVAVVVASNSDPIIINAVDTDCHLSQAALEKHGVFVKELCPREITRALEARK